MITDQEIILDELVAFFRKLYKKTTLGLDCNWLKSKLEKSCCLQFRKSAQRGEKTIQGHVYLQVLKRMTKNKSPGKDRLLVEFYLCFWEELKTILLEAINFSRTKNVCQTHKEKVL